MCWSGRAGWRRRCPAGHAGGDAAGHARHAKHALCVTLIFKNKMDMMDGRVFVFSTCALTAAGMGAFEARLVAVGGAIGCLLYALYPDAAILSAILLGFLLGAEFDVLAFLIKRYYGNLAYGKAYGVIFAFFYLGSGLGITGLAWMRQQFGSYDEGLFTAAVILVGSALILTRLPKYRFLAGVGN